MSKIDDDSMRALSIIGMLINGPVWISSGNEKDCKIEGNELDGNDCEDNDDEDSEDNEEELLGTNRIEAGLDLWSRRNLSVRTSLFDFSAFP